MIGFPESETGSPTERHFHDRDIIDKLLEAMNVTDVEVKNHYRVRRSNGRHNGKRPINRHQIREHGRKVESTEKDFCPPSKS